MRCECGHNYVRGHPADEAEHARLHAEYSLGPKIRAVGQLSTCETYRAFSIYEINQTCPISIRCEMAHVALVACRSMSGYPVGYDGTVTEDHDQRLYIAAHKGHVVAMLLTARDIRFWRLHWKADGSITLVGQEASMHKSYKIARVWTAGDYRRKGLALRLIQAASRLLPCDIADLGWELPPTPDGKSLVKRIRPNEFWGCGSPDSLHQTLGTCQE